MSDSKSRKQNQECNKEWRGRTARKTNMDGWIFFRLGKLCFDGATFFPMDSLLHNFLSEKLTSDDAQTTLLQLQTSDNIQSFQRNQHNMGMSQNYFDELVSIAKFQANHSSNRNVCMKMIEPFISWFSKRMIRSSSARKASIDRQCVPALQHSR